MNYWISSAFDAVTYKKICDSLRLEIINNQNVIRADSVVIHDAIAIKQAKNETINAQEKLALIYKTDSESKEKKIKRWKYIAFGAWLYEIGKSIYQSITHG